MVDEGRTALGVCATIFCRASHLSTDRSPLASLAKQLYRDQQHTLDLLAPPKSGSSFELVADRLFGTEPTQGKTVRIGNQLFIYGGRSKNLLSLLPLRWHTALESPPRVWKGCENWWAGYPVAVLLEAKVGDEKASGYWTINAEVGPLSDHEVRSSIINSITDTAAKRNVKRIRFRPGAFGKGRLYSRFFRQNSIAVENIQHEHDVADKLIQLVSNFEPEFECVADAILQFVRPGNQ